MINIPITSYQNVHVLVVQLAFYLFFFTGLMVLRNKLQPTSVNRQENKLTSDLKLYNIHYHFKMRNFFHSILPLTLLFRLRSRKRQVDSWSIEFLK